MNIGDFIAYVLSVNQNKGLSMTNEKLLNALNVNEDFIGKPIRSVINVVLKFLRICSSR